MQGRQYALNGEPDKTKKATITAFVLNIIGFFTGITVVVIVFILRSHDINESEETSNQPY